MVTPTPFSEKCGRQRGERVFGASSKGLLNSYAARKYYPIIELSHLRLSFVSWKVENQASRSEPVSNRGGEAWTTCRVMTKANQAPQAGTSVTSPGTNAGLRHRNR